MQGKSNLAVDYLLDGLNAPQHEAVTHQDGPLLILAGPGSGKTRVVTRRAAYLACTVTEPRNILAITFTNKAAREMRERIGALDVADGMTVGTFHAFCAWLLRVYHDRAGVPREFTIFDRDDRRKAVKEAIAASELSTENWTVASVEHDISRAKNAMLSPEALDANACDFRDRTVARIYAAYELVLARMKALDFDDLLLRGAKLLAADSELRERLEDRYRYVLIDEYQDTNASQYQLARLLTRDRSNLCATGDPDQSVYGWRGADIQNILNFERDYPDAKVVRLEQNYRSSKRILAAADALIAGNRHRKKKTLWTENAVGAAVRIIDCDDGETEARMIAQDLARSRAGGADLSDTAVFYRLNSLSRTLEEAFLREGIAYQIARGVEFYSRREIKDVLAYLRVLVNPADELSLLRIINTPPRGIGARTIERLVALARSTETSPFEVLMSDHDLSGLGRASERVRAFAELLRGLTQALARPVSEALELVISRSGLRAHYGGEKADEMEDAAINNIDELVSAACEFQSDHPGATVLDWLEHTALLSDVDTVKDGSGAVTLMTLHAAKGLEFGSAYIIGLEDGLIPFRRREEGSVDEEEERRLLFVGLTRAKNRLTLSRARYRMSRGVTERTTESPFLRELPPDQVEWSEVGKSRSRRQPSGRNGSLPDDIEQWMIGTLVRHPVHGLGRITSLHRGARRTHVDVRFQNGSEKSWVLEFAGLERVDFDEIGDTCDVEGV